MALKGKIEITFSRLSQILGLPKGVNIVRVDEGDSGIVHVTVRGIGYEVPEGSVMPVAGRYIGIDWKC